MIKLYTPVADKKCQTELSFDDRILMLGSCFSDNIGRQLQDYGFNVCVNPFGTLYNPISILNSLRRIAENRTFSEEDCVQMGSGSPLFCSFSHHTSFARQTVAEFIENAGKELKKAHDWFGDCSTVIITLGTSWCFRHKEKRMIVSNCLKRNAAEFSRIRLSTKEVTAALEEIAEIARNRKIIFTVSPIRHMADGAHGNQLSKATLLLGIDDFLSAHEGRYDYFPAFELMMDELRDYRFYAEDMTHPSTQAVSYIRERFLDWCLPDSEKPLLESNIKKYKQSRHITKI